MEKEDKETKELLKRGEIQTMKKDISKLREIEAEKERERIASLKLKEEKPSSEQPKETTSKTILIPQPPKKGSQFKKYLIRILLILFIFSLIGGYWSLIRKKETVPPQKEIPPPPKKEKVVTKVTKESKVPPFSIKERKISWGYYFPKTPRLIDTIIIHSAYNALGGDPHDLEKVIQEFKIYRVAPHYLISREGEVYRLVPDKAIAFHAGAGRMPDGSRVNIINNFSIGIELIYTKTEAPTDKQYQSLAILVKNLRQQYNIPLKNILGYNEIAPNQKTNPWNFDWSKFKEMLNQ